MVLLFKGIAPLSHESLSHPGHHCCCKGDKIRKGYITPAFSEAQKWAELLQNPCVLGVPQQRGQNQKKITDYKLQTIGHCPHCSKSVPNVALSSPSGYPMFLGLTWVTSTLPPTGPDRHRWGCLGQASGNSPSESLVTHDPPNQLESVSHVSSISTKPSSSEMSVTCFECSTLCRACLAPLDAHRPPLRSPPPLHARGLTGFRHCAPVVAIVPTVLSISLYAPMAPVTLPTCVFPILHIWIATLHTPLPNPTPPAEVSPDICS